MSILEHESGSSPISYSSSILTTNRLCWEDLALGTTLIHFTCRPYFGVDSNRRATFLSVKMVTAPNARYCLYIVGSWLLIILPNADSLSPRSHNSPLRRIATFGSSAGFGNYRLHASVPKDVGDEQILQSSKIHSETTNPSDEEDDNITLSSQASQLEIENNVPALHQDDVNGKSSVSGSKMDRFLAALPRIGQNDEIDTAIRNTAVPNVINLGVVPLVNSVDTFWVGRLGSALALAGQGKVFICCRSQDSINTMAPFIVSFSLLTYCFCFIHVFDT